MRCLTGTWEAKPGTGGGETIPPGSVGRFFSSSSEIAQIKTMALQGNGVAIGLHFQMVCHF